MLITSFTLNIINTYFNNKSKLKFYFYNYDFNIYLLYNLLLSYLLY